MQYTNSRYCIVNKYTTYTSYTHHTNTNLYLIAALTLSSALRLVKQGTLYILFLRTINCTRLIAVALEAS